MGYVIYYDQKNVLRKERSWQSWRQENLGFNDYPNEPLEGFVLNKHVGGYKSDWNFRQSYCRIYDPRGFEFEITIDNLLWILDWEDCMHGKGLTGKYVYGWIGDQLVLIPCCTDDYKVSQEYSDRMFNESNLKTKDPRKKLQKSLDNFTLCLKNTLNYNSLTPFKQITHLFLLVI